MSNLENAVFGAQLTGQMMSGGHLGAADITSAALNADLASKLAGTDQLLSSTEEVILRAKIASKVAMDGHYNPVDIVADHLDAHVHAQLSDDMMG
jgi:hypothetical protein